MVLPVFTVPPVEALQPMTPFASVARKDDVEQFGTVLRRIPPLVMFKPPATWIPPVKVEEAAPVTESEPAERPLVNVEVPAPATDRRPVRVPPPVTFKPLVDSRPPAMRPPVKVFVAELVW